MKSDIFLEWRRLNRDISRVDAEAAEARQELERFVAAHCRDCPLSLPARQKLFEALRERRPLCCAQGKKLLDDVVDPIWAEVLNEWAYEALTCKGQLSVGDVEDHIYKLDQKLTRLSAKPNGLRVDHEERTWFEGGDRFYIRTANDEVIALAPTREVADWIAAQLPLELQKQ